MRREMMLLRVTFGVSVFCAQVWAAMPPAEQNALVQKYCAVCHTDRVRNGGLSLQRYDAARRDPGLAIMILSKLKDGAMGAAGNGVPNPVAQQAWLESTREQSAGAQEWFVSRESGILSAGIVREVAPRGPKSTNSPLYRLKLVCNSATGVGEVQLTWSPQSQTGRAITVTTDANSPVDYRVDGKESMGNGASVQSGLASIGLTNRGGAKFELPVTSLTLRDLFPGETVEFPFSGLPARSELNRCF